MHTSGSFEFKAEHFQHHLQLIAWNTDPLFQEPFPRLISFYYGFKRGERMYNMVEEGIRTVGLQKAAVLCCRLQSPLVNTGLML